MAKVNHYAIIAVMGVREFFCVLASDHIAIERYIATLVVIASNDSQKHFYVVKISTCLNAAYEVFLVSLSPQSIVCI